METTKIVSSSNKRIEKYFIGTTSFFLGIYGLFILFILGSILFYTNVPTIITNLLSKKTFHSIYLTLFTSSITTLMSIIIGIPAGYALSRYNFKGKKTIESIIDIPITLPPLVAGLSLLIFFSLPLGQYINTEIVKFTYAVPGIILAQFFISASFAIITLKGTFDEVDESYEVVARSLGCNRFQAFFKITLPIVRFGIASACVLTWARAVGEFVPIMLFCGIMEWKTDILPLAIFVNIEMGNLSASVALTLIFIALVLLVLPISRLLVRKSKNV